MRFRHTWRLPNMVGSSSFKYAFGLTVVLVTTVGLLLDFAQERRREIETIAAEARNATYDLDQAVRRFADHAEILRTAFEAELANPRSHAASLAMTARLHPSRFFDGYALDDVPADREAETGSVTGTGTLEPTNGDLTQELAAALSIHPLFRLSKRNIPNAPWFYYVSRRRFISIYPWMPSSEQHFTSELLSKELFVMGTPEANPERRPFWTSPYYDLFGRGLMVTVGAPVYRGDAFLGTVDIDLTLDTLDDYIDQRQPYRGEAALTTWQGRRFAGGHTPEAETIRNLPLGQPASIDGMLTVVHRLDNAPWLMVSRISDLAVTWRTLTRMQMLLFVTGAGLLCVAFLFGQVMTTRALARKKEQLEKVMDELVRARDDAQIANRAKSAFLANIGHEIRTPLNAIIGFADLIPTMAEGAPKRATLEEYSTYIKDAGDHLLRVLNDLLDLAKAEANRIELLDSPIDPRQLVTRCLRMVEPQAEKGQLTLSTGIHPDVQQVRGDDVRMRQILINLLSNAIKFTPVGGSVEVDVEPMDDGRLRIAVRDTGVGIAAKDIPKALEPFGQINNEMSRKHRGTGLGLALTRRLVELHGGELRIDSQVGLGTTASIILPADRVLRTQSIA